MTTLNVAVIGGGFTGLSCATQLSSQGARVTMFEREHQLGGLAAGFREPTWDWNLEHYYHHWFQSDDFVLKYADLWNVKDKVFFDNPSTVMQTESHGFVPLDSAIALLRYPELRFHEKIRMGASLAYLKVTRNWRELERSTAEEWCRKIMGTSGFEAIWKPLLIGKFGHSYADKVNMAWLWSRISCRTPALGSCLGGFASYIQAGEDHLAKNGVEIKKNAKDLRLEWSGRNWKVARSEGAEQYDRVVVAASPIALSNLLGRPSGHSKSEKPFLGAQVVLLSIDQPLGDHYWYSLRKSENQPFLALIEHTNFIPSKHYGGETLVYLADYVDPNSPEWRRTDDELVEAAVRTCQGIRAGFTRSHVKRHWIFREHYAQPIPFVNASASLPTLEVEGCPGLFHAGMGHVYPWDRGTNFALELGEKVARKILQ